MTLAALALEIADVIKEAIETIVAESFCSDIKAEKLKKKPGRQQNENPRKPTR